MGCCHPRWRHHRRSQPVPQPKGEPPKVGLERKTDAPRRFETTLTGTELIRAAHCHPEDRVPIYQLRYNGKLITKIAVCPKCNRAFPYRGG